MEQLSVEDLSDIFRDEIAYDWVDMYKAMGYGLQGYITSPLLAKASD